jgi:hypothetical protein
MDEKTAHDLIPLELAVRTIYARVYEAQHRKAGLICGPEQLDGIAHEMAALVPVFAYGKNPASIRKLSEQELQKGMFKEGGRRMIFLDGRAPIQSLAVSADALESVARELSAGGGK